MLLAFELITCKSSYRWINFCLSPPHQDRIKQHTQQQITNTSTHTQMYFLSELFFYNLFTSKFLKLWVELQRPVIVAFNYIDYQQVPKWLPYTIAHNRSFLRMISNSKWPLNYLQPLHIHLFWILPHEILHPVLTPLLISWRPRRQC